MLSLVIHVLPRDSNTSHRLALLQQSADAFLLMPRGHAQPLQSHKNLHQILIAARTLFENTLFIEG